MLALIIVFAAIVTAIHLRMMTLIADEERAQVEFVEEANGGTFTDKAWDVLVEQAVMPAVQHVISLAYAVYMRLTLINVTICLIKYVPSGLYMYKVLKDIYSNSRERIKQKQIEMEDIQLQIQIVNTKLCVRNAEFGERAELLRRGAERLRRVRARVRGLIAADAALQHTPGPSLEPQPLAPPEEDRAFIEELLKELQFDQFFANEKSREKVEMDRERAHSEPLSASPEPSVYSSLSDTDVRSDCRVRIVRVTNVYKVAYLKHYVKQKRLRRAIKQALLKKKMENIKKLLEDWQKTLNMVINSKLTILNIDPHPMDVTSQAMGDYSKPRGSSDSDSDRRNSWSDVNYDDYSQNWTENPYRPYAYNYEDVSESATPRGFYESQDYGDVKYSTPPVYCECGKLPNMTSIIEETNSQVASAEHNEDDFECRDLIAL